MTSVRRLMVFLIVWLAWGSLEAVAQRRPWLTDKQVEQQLRQPIQITWSQTPLGTALKNLAKSQRIAILLDRRIDPDQKLQLAIANEPLELALQRIAQRTSLGVSFFGSATYFGPPQVAQRLRTLSELRRAEAQKTPPEVRRKLLQSRPWQWPMLATPRELLTDLAEEAGVEVQNIEVIPHDLLPPGDLPALVWTDRATLLLAQFDLTFEFEADGRKVRVVSIPKHVTLVHSYPAGERAGELARKWSNRLPTARITAQGDQVTVDASAEDHELIKQALRGMPAKRRTVTAGTEVYSLSFQNVPLNGVIEHLKKTLKLDIEFDRPSIDAAKIQLDQLISIRIESATLDELLDSILRPAALTFRRQGQQIKIHPLSGQMGDK